MLGNVTVLTATSAIAASNAQPRYSDELTFTLTQKLRIPTKFSNRKPSIFSKSKTFGIW